MAEKITALTLEINKLLHEIAGNTPKVVDEEYEVTARMLAVNSGISDNTARTCLEKLAKEGKLIARDAKTRRGNRVVAYRKP